MRDSQTGFSSRELSSKKNRDLILRDYDKSRRHFQKHMHNSFKITGLGATPLNGEVFGPD